MIRRFRRLIRWKAKVTLCCIVAVTVAVPFQGGNRLPSLPLENVPCCLPTGCRATRLGIEQARSVAAQINRHLGSN